MLYESKCGGCHSLDENRVGPRHRGVVGRKVASIADYDYSPAIRKLGGVWTAARIDQWLQGPQKLAPGAKMFFQVPDPAQRVAIIAYLAANSPPSEPTAPTPTPPTPQLTATQATDCPARRGGRRPGHLAVCHR